MAMAKEPQGARPELSKSEWIVMNACWDLGKSTARQVYEHVAAQKKWDYQTVKTMLDRIAEKGYLNREKLGPLCLFAPAVPRRKAVTRAIENFADTVLGNAVAPLFAHFANARKLTDEDLAALKKLIEEHDGGRK